MLKLDVSNLIQIFEMNCKNENALVGSVCAGILSEFVDLPGP